MHASTPRRLTFFVRPSPTPRWASRRRVSSMTRVSCSTRCGVSPACVRPTRRRCSCKRLLRPRPGRTRSCARPLHISSPPQSSGPRAHACSSVASSSSCSAAGMKDSFSTARTSTFAAERSSRVRSALRADSARHARWRRVVTPHINAALPRRESGPLRAASQIAAGCNGRAHWRGLGGADSSRRRPRRPAGRLGHARSVRNALTTRRSSEARAA